MSSTLATDLLVIAYQALSEEEQEEVAERLDELRLLVAAKRGSESARMIASLAEVAANLAHAPTVDEYRRARERLVEEGRDLEPVSRIIRHFGSWRLAKEALQLSETTSVRRIDARFRARKLGKVWSYHEDTLRETLARCVADLGRIPQVAEFDWWRQRELELARAEGNDALHLPSAGPYRRRWGSWAGALLHFGYSQTEIDARLERP